MSGPNLYVDDELLIPYVDDQTITEPWQPINTPYHGVSGYERSSYPINTDGGGRLNEAEDYRDEYTDEIREYYDVEEPPGHYSQGQRCDYSDDEEMLVPPREDQRRPRWDMVSNPYQTQRFYDDPGHTESQGCLQYTQSSSANASTNSNNISLVPPGTSHSQSVSNEHFEDYTALSWLTLVCCCLPLGIAALVLARDAQTSLRKGRREEALEKARSSRNLNIAGITIGPLIFVVVIVMKLFVLNH